MSFFDSVLANTQTQIQATSAPVIDAPIIEAAPVIEPLSARVASDYCLRKQELFEVESAPISGPHGIIDNKQGLFVNGECVNLVSGKYEVHQPNEILAQFQKVEREHGLQINKVLTNPHKGALLISAKYDQTKITGEKHDVNLVFYTSHCGKFRTVLSCDLLRIACFNQIPTIMANKSRHLFAEKHYRNALDIDVIGKSIAEVPRMVNQYNRKANLLRDTKLSISDFIDIWTTHYKQEKTAKQYDSKVAKAREIYSYATGQRELEDSAYKAYQAFTFMNTHETKDTKHQLETVQHANMADSQKVLDYLVEYCEA